jgi:mannose-6-phosphate isomerase-like protein (cupin superfamily)
MHPKHKTVYKEGNNTANAQFAKVEEKKWGKEFIYTLGPEYALKAMTIEPGHQVSMHMHKIKTETFLVVSGVLIVETIEFKTGEKSIHTLNPYDALTLCPESLHTFYCPEDQLSGTIFIEASTQDSPDDNYRVFPSK